jgi:hypothetical protein
MIGRVVMVIAAVALIAYSIISIINAIEFNSNGVETVAEVTGMKQHERNIDETYTGNDPFEQDIHYKYTVDGKVYTGKYLKKFKSGEAIIPPETVRIQYLPNRPGVSDLAGKKNVPLTAATGVGLTALGAIILRTAFKRKKTVSER